MCFTCVGLLTRRQENKGTMTFNIENNALKVVPNVELFNQMLFCHIYFSVFSILRSVVRVNL